MDTNSLAHKLTDWRHELHRHPETAFDEHYTSAFLADRLEEMGITVTRGIGGTGLVGTLKKRNTPQRRRAAHGYRRQCHYRTGKPALEIPESGTDACLWS